jgi:hypothetical protein
MDKKNRLNEAVAYLKYKGIVKTQVDIASKMKASRSNVSSALAGTQSALTDNFIRRFCDEFTEISYTWLQSGEGDMLSNKKTKEINWKDAFKDEGFLNELRKYCEQYAENKTGSEEAIDEILNDIFKYDEKTEDLIVNKGAGKTEGTEQKTNSDDDNKQPTEEDKVAIAQKIKLSTLLSLMLDNGLNIDKTNSSMFRGNKIKTAQIMHRITGIKFQTCLNFLEDPCVSSKTPDDYITGLNFWFIKIGLKIRLKKKALLI